MAIEISLSLRKSLYPLRPSAHTILDFADRESIETEYVAILRELIMGSSGCNSIMVTGFTDYRGRYPVETRLLIGSGLRTTPLVSGMKIETQAVLDDILKMSFRKLISVRLVACGEVEVRTHDDGIGATVLAKSGAKIKPDIFSKCFDIIIEQS